MLGRSSIKNSYNPFMKTSQNIWVTGYTPLFGFKFWDCYIHRCFLGKGSYTEGKMADRLS
jgi:hypothetical protein